MNKLRILVLVLLPVLFFECKKTKEFRIEGTIYKDCFTLSRNEKYEIVFHDPYCNDHKAFGVETTILKEFTTDENGHFDIHVRELKTNYYYTYLCLTDDISRMTYYIKQQSNITSAVYYKQKSFLMNISLKPNSALSVTDTLYYSINYNSIKKIVGPFSYQSISDTINGFTAKTDIKWAVGWDNFNSASAKTATISLPADCGSSTSCEMVFP
ncbi:MAG: hypothetical protein RJA07_428 [Bacteroidota bacterium]|jgi:hypothetical protein